MHAAPLTSLPFGIETPALTQSALISIPSKRFDRTNMCKLQKLSFCQPSIRCHVYQFMKLAS
jgi:hypothetical protein